MPNTGPVARAALPLRLGRAADTDASSSRARPCSSSSPVQPPPRHHFRSSCWAAVWELIPFTLQMALIIITGYVMARPRWGRAIHAIAPAAQRRAARCAGDHFVRCRSWFNGGFSLVFARLRSRSPGASKASNYPRLRAASVLQRRSFVCP